MWRKLFESDPLGLELLASEVSFHTWVSYERRCLAAPRGCLLSLSVLGREVFCVNLLAERYSDECVIAKMPAVTSTEDSSHFLKFTIY